MIGCGQQLLQFGLQPLCVMGHVNQFRAEHLALLIQNVISLAGHLQ